MFGLETWFLWALASVAFGGVHTFLQKVVAERGYSSAHFNALCTAVSAVLALALSIPFDSKLLFSFGALLAVAGGLFHMFGSLWRVDALRHIHATLYFPLYKAAGPIITLIIGLMYYGERFSSIQWFGLVLGIGVPLLLIDLHERSRQNNLVLGLILVLVSAFCTAISAAFAKSGSVFMPLVLFIAISHAFGSLSGWGMYLREKLSGKTENIQKSGLVLAVIAGIVQFLSFGSLLLAFKGPFALAYAINSLYIVIPIILSIWIYKEHWNMRKVAAIFVSLCAVFLMS